MGGFITHGGQTRLHRGAARSPARGKCKSRGIRPKRLTGERLIIGVNNHDGLREIRSIPERPNGAAQNRDAPQTAILFGQTAACARAPTRGHNQRHERCSRQRVCGVGWAEFIHGSGDRG